MQLLTEVRASATLRTPERCMGAVIVSTPFRGCATILRNIAVAKEFKNMWWGAGVLNQTTPIHDGYTVIMDNTTHIGHSSPTPMLAPSLQPTPHLGGLTETPCPSCQAAAQATQQVTDPFCHASVLFTVFQISVV